jgi:hypothetical protein
LDNLDRHREHQELTNALYDSPEDLHDDVKEIGRKIDRGNSPLSQVKSTDCLYQSKKF